MVGLPSRPWAQGSKGPQNNYTLSCFARNATVELYVNGAPTALHTSLKDMAWTFFVPDFLRDGANRIDIAYEPLNPEERNYTPNPDVAIQAELAQGREEPAILFNASYDMEEGRLAPRETEIFSGIPVRRDAGSISRVGAGSEEPFVIRSGKGNATRPEYTRILGVEFQIDDPSLRDVAWAGTEPLTDTPEMREALWQAMAQLYQAVERKDRAAFVEIARPYLSRLAYILGKPDAEAAAAMILESAPWASDKVASLRPLMSRQEARDAALLFGSDRRLVCFADYQVAALDHDGDFLSLLPVYFARQPSDPFRVCFS
ncbi:hypothetical protein JMK10_22135 [Rhodovulum sulfidophilum]|uniref:hypothetical protein n=1 Tax=Rhodovulum sulfidophilum TaxID=35806 RepID=UPI001923E1A9|nr:hypothetical protein [Rhodovulum sulfidophilum]MBL3574192.1 hypothetical protein [Rhodovulum sulfidophilum]MCE8433383.1 hypothetical protein [Rhodovulum sulfidophilum]MCF4119349.1 hypothetical protein [Rhodovulum sulfidophilum]